VIEKFGGDLQADQFCPGCIMSDKSIFKFKYPLIRNNEDCLCLNIWRPKNSDKNLPVNIWI